MVNNNNNNNNNRTNAAMILGTGLIAKSKESKADYANAIK